MKIGQGVLGIVPFKDGTVPAYRRTYLVVGVTGAEVELLNVSSSDGKEHKLLYQSNRVIVNYRPPFLKRSFVKLDSLVSIPLSTAKSLKILHNGDCLDGNELQLIIDSIIR